SINLSPGSCRSVAPVPAPMRSKTQARTSQLRFLAPQVKSVRLMHADTLHGIACAVHWRSPDGWRTAGCGIGAFRGRLDMAAHARAWPRGVAARLRVLGLGPLGIDRAGPDCHGLRPGSNRPGAGHGERERELTA